MMKNQLSITFLFLLMLFRFTSEAQIFTENFEVADSVVSSGSQVWTQNTRVFMSPVSCDSTTLINPGDQSYLTTIQFSTIGYDSVYLNFNHICKVEFFDEGVIEVSADGGVSWVKLENNTSMASNCTYYGLGLFSSQGSKFQEANYGTWLPGTTGTPESTWFKREVFDVTDLLQNTSSAQIRFALRDLNLNGGSGRNGWFIDDLILTDTCGNCNVQLKNHLTGKMFVDMNSNLIKDSQEPGIKNRMIRDFGGHIDFTNNWGEYDITTLTIGVVNVQPDPTIVTHLYFNLVPPNNTATFTALGQVDSLNDFALQPTANANDLLVNLTSTPTNHHSIPMVKYWIEVYNRGSTILDPTIVLYPSSLLTYDSASITPSAISPDSIIWNLNNLYPFQRLYIDVRMQKLLGLNIGTPILTTTKVEPVAGDVYDTDNFDYTLTYISSAIDPNIIVVDSIFLSPDNIASSVFLEYTIYFQNTGNDSAHNVRVDNLIPAELDINTFELVANSHDMEIKFDYFVNPRLLSFTYDNIMLPDSTTNESESHGFVKYRIKPLSTLVVGDSIINSADIYFDLNPPVTTNTAITEIVDPTSVSENLSKSSWNIFPNPVSQELTINFKTENDEQIKIEVYNFYGQKMQTLIEEKVSNGDHHRKFNIESLSSGVYMIQFYVGEQRLVRKFVKVD